MSNIGFIGLGIMGRPVAGHLITGGHKLFVHDALDRPAGSPKRLTSRSSSSRSRSSGLSAKSAPNSEAEIFLPITP
jgi:2-hydroxy-3-oxopropionate reductase